MPHPTISPAKRRNRARLKRRLWQGLGGFIALSLLLHLIGLISVGIAKWLPEKARAEQSQEELEEAYALHEEAMREEMLEQQRATLEQQLLAAYEGITTDVDQETVDMLWEQTQLKIDAAMIDFNEQFEQEDYDASQFNADFSALSAQMFESIAKALKEQLRKELKQATLDQVEAHTLNKIATDLDSRMEEQIGNFEKQRLTRAAQNDTKRRNKGKKNNTPDPALPLEEAKRAVDKLAAEQQSLAQKTQQVEATQALSDSQTKRADEMQEAIITDLEQSQQQLDKAIEETKPSSKALAEAQKNIEEAKEQQEATRGKLAKNEPTSETTQAAADKLKEASEQLATEIENIRNEKDVDLEAKQGLKAVVESQVKEQVQDEFDATLTETLAPDAADRILKQAERYFDEFDLGEDMELRTELKDELTSMIETEVPERMKDKASELALDKTEESLSLDEVEASESELNLTDQQQADLAKLEADASSNLEESRRKNVARQVEAAKTSAELGDMTARMEALRAKMAMMQKAEMMAQQLEEGRGEMGEIGDMMALMQMMDGAGQGSQPPGQMSPWGFKYPTNLRGQTNLQVYQQMLEMARKREQPGAVYEDIEQQAQQMVSKASTAFPEQRDAVIIDPRKKVDPQDEAKQKNDATERKVPEPSFDPVKYGYATMVRTKPVLDGNLDEWDFDRALLAQDMNKAKLEPVVLPEDQAIPFCVMWDHDGLYIAAHVNNGDYFPLPMKHMWAGTSIEVWVDTLETHGSLMTYPEAIQMFFCPFGFQGNSDIVGQIRRGKASRAIKEDVRFTRQTPNGLRIAAKKTAIGYDVELFAPHGTVIQGPPFKAGRHIGFQISFNYVTNEDNVAWARRTGNSWDIPNMWGDVLLLGSDAEVTFHRDEAYEKPLDLIVPGEPVWIKVHDPDMNIDPRFKDQILVNAVGAGQFSKVVVLGETEPNSGIFVGGLETNSAYVGLSEESLPLEPGSSLDIVYIDQRRGYGESNQTVRTSLQTAWPVMRISRND